MAEEFPKKITKITSQNFSIDEFGLYSITMMVRGNLSFEIEDLKLKLKTKVVIFILQLNKGKHPIQFIPTGEAIIESFSIKEIKNFQDIQFALDKQAEDVDRKPWLTFALINLPLKSISADVTVGWHLFDGDDVKLTVDNKIKKNTSSKRHTDWLWSASLLYLLSGPKREEKAFTENLSSGIHYIEFWADKTPTLHKVILNLGDITLKRIPTHYDPEWTGNFADDTDNMILGRALFGEARSELVPDKARVAIGWVIRNRVKDSRWANTYWEVITQPFQYSAFNKDDNNRSFVENPLHTGLDINQKAWEHVYEIAKKIINNEFKDPTHGANHYYDDSINTPDWAKNKLPSLTITYKNEFDKNATIFFFRL